MKSAAVEYAEYGTADVLKLVEVDEPQPGSGEVRILVKAAGVNPVDAKIRSGKRASGPLDAPARLGADAGGIIDAVGEDVVGFQVGDAVIARGLRGGYATHVIATPRNLTPKPTSMSFEQAAAVGVPVGTAYQVLRSVRLASDDVVLVHAGAGAVGQAVIQFAVAEGAVVIATASSVNHDRLRALGALPVTYGPGLEQRVREIAPDGVDASIDAAGTDEAIEVSIALTHDRQRIVEIVNMTWRDKYGVLGFTSSIPGYLGAEELELRIQGVRAMTDLFEAGRFDLEVGRVFPLSEAAAAHAAVESGGVRGKIVLVP